MIKVRCRIRGIFHAASVATLAVLVSGCWVEDRPPRPSGQDLVTGASLPEIEHIYPEGVARLPVFTPAVRVGDLLFLSGAIGTAGEELKVVDGGAAAETRQTLRNLRTVIEAAGGTLRDVVKCTVFLSDMEHYQAMNEVYIEFFPDNPPARSAMAGSGLALGALVEIECIARAPRP